jgi:hypothetical protein
MSPRALYWFSLIVCTIDIGIAIYAYSLRPSGVFVLFAGFFLALAVEAVRGLRRLPKPGVRA